jgi:FixJ family two-component response regulator
VSGASPTVFVIDDDSSVREALESLFQSVGLDVRVFSAAQDFMQAKPSDGAGCLVLDVRMPGLSGLDLQRELARTSPGIPIVFITGHGDIPMAVSAMQAGAVGFLTKPFRDQELLDAVQSGIARGRARVSREAVVTDIRDRYQTLTAREREVMHLVASGKLNKQVAAALGVSEVTVKVHRAQVMRKMNARSLADLVRMVDQIAIVSAAH